MGCAFQLSSSSFAGVSMAAIHSRMPAQRGIDKSASRQAIVRNMARICEDLSIAILAEGIETLHQCLALQSMGVHLMQGYLFSKPVFQACARADQIAWPKG